MRYTDWILIASFKSFMKEMYSNLQFNMSLNCECFYSVGKIQIQ